MAYKDVADGSSQPPLEYCVECEDPTGRAGRAEDSLFCAECECGPFCSECFGDYDLCLWCEEAG